MNIPAEETGIIWGKFFFNKAMQGLDKKIDS
jgi:hypothetical protein